MRSLRNTLRGKKTYAVVLLTAAYLLGADKGWWPRNDEVLALFALLGTAALRAAISRGGQQP